MKPLYDTEWEPLSQYINSTDRFNKSMKSNSIKAVFAARRYHNVLTQTIEQLFTTKYNIDFY